MNETESCANRCHCDDRMRSCCARHVASMPAPGIPSHLLCIVCIMMIFFLLNFYNLYSKTDTASANFQWGHRMTWVLKMNMKFNTMLNNEPSTVTDLNKYSSYFIFKLYIPKSPTLIIRLKRFHLYYLYFLRCWACVGCCIIMSNLWWQTLRHYIKSPSAARLPCSAYNNFISASRTMHREDLSAPVHSYKWNLCFSLI